MGKKIVIVLLLVAVSFTNLPFSVLSQIVDAYDKSRPIVDRMWLAKQDSNVVDKFIPLDHFLASLKVPEANAAVANNGMLMKGGNASAGTFYYNTLTSPNTFGAETTTGVASSASGLAFVVTKASPVRNEKMSGHIKVDGRLDVVHGNGTTHVAGFNVVGVSAAMTCDATYGLCWKPFDIAYEQLNGRAMVAYGKNATAGTVYYNIWNGTAWAGEASVALTGSTGVPKWVRLVAEGEQLTNRRSNRVLMIMGDANGRTFAAIWDGTAWGNQVALNTVAATVIHSQTFDGAWENTTGNAMVVYAEGVVDATTPFKYKRFISDTATWDAVGTAIDVWTTSLGRWVKMASSPLDTKNNIGIILQASASTDGATEVSRQIRPFIWSGAAMTAGNALTTSEYPLAPITGVAFEKLSGHGLFTYSAEKNTDATAYQTWIEGTGFSASTDMPGAMNDDVNTMKLYGSPNSDEIRWLGADIDKNIQNQRWSGAAWNASIPAAVGTSVFPGGINANAEAVSGYDYAMTPYSPWTRNWRWYDDETSATPVTPLANENTSATVIQGNMVRLRFQAAELGGMAATASRKKLQYTSCADPNALTCVWTDVDVQAGAGIWRYADGAGVDDTTFTTTVLTGSDATGAYIENGTAASTFGHGAAGSTSDIPEWDYAVQNNTAPAATYYFRMYANDQALAIQRDQTNGSVTFTYPAAVSAAASLSLTIAATAGAKVASLNSGDVTQFVNTISCTAESSCAAFKLTAGGGSVTVTSIKLTETGTVAATTDLSNPTLIYDTDVNYSNGTAGTFGTVANFAADQTVNFTNAGLVIPDGSTYYFYIRFDVKSGTPTYPAGGQGIDFQIAANADIGTSGTPTKSGAPVSLASAVSSCTTASQTCVRPQITGYTNSTEVGLNYAASCVGCGVRIGPAASARSQTVVISGYGFGADPGLGSRDTAANMAQVVGASTHTFQDNGVGNTNVTAWNNTSITVTSDTGVTNDDDTSWGTDFGGAAALKITAGSQAAPTNFNFYIFPQVTSLTVCNSAGFPVGDNAREYNSADVACPNGLKDGEIILNGTRFGTASTGGYVRILGCSATTCVAPSDSVITSAWSNTAITAQVPAVIAENSYTGSVAIQQGLSSSNKTHTYTTNGFRVLPRITGFTPTSGISGDAITVNGNHFCQNGGVCPTVFGVNDKVTFTNNVGATAFTSWTDTAMSTQVPAGAVTGNVVLTSNSYASNGSSFTVTSPTPNDPTNLNQFSSSTLNQIIAVGGAVSTTPIYLTMLMQAPISGGTLYPQIEYKPVGTAFTCAGTSTCASATEGGGAAGPGPVDCSAIANSCAVTITPTDNTYHWQARVRHRKNAVDYFSGWVSFPSSTNPEAATDFQIDTVSPVITSGPSASPQANSATVTWETSGEQSTSQVQYNTTGSFAASCAANNDCTALDLAYVFSHSVILNNLDSGTLYYYRVRSKDAAGNETMSVNNTFTTASITQPGKTTIFFVTSSVNGLIGLATSSFSVYMPETLPVIKDAYVEITGFTQDTIANSITVSVNAQPSQAFVVDTGQSFFRILYKVDPANVAVDPQTNEFSITTSLNTTITSARIIVTYAYTP